MAQNSESVPVPKVYAYYTYGPVDRDIDDYGSLFDTYMSHRQPVKSTEEKEGEKQVRAKTTTQSRTSPFRAKAGDTYQRTLRVSPWKGADAQRIAAIATGLAPWGEIVFFKATPTPTEADVIGRIRLDSGEEAEDVDIASLDMDDGGFKVTYTNGLDVFTCLISSETRPSTVSDVCRVYSMPAPKPGAKKPKFRALRFLSPTALVCLQNAPDRGGCELVVLNLPPRCEKSGSGGEITQRRSLRPTMKIGLGLDVCNLGTDAEGRQQSLLAVSGSDLSIEILTINYTPRRNPRSRFSRPKPYTTLKDVHGFSMTELCFSPFTPPPRHISPKTGPQNVKLTSLSMGNTVVVHTLSLSPFPPLSRTPRYVLDQPVRSDTTNIFLSMVLAALYIFLGCLSLQAFAEIRGASAPYLGLVNWVPEDLRTAVAKPYMIPPEEELFKTFAASVPTAQATPNPNSNSHAQTKSKAQGRRRDALRTRLVTDFIFTADSPLVINCRPASSTAILGVQVFKSASPDLRARVVPWRELSSTAREMCLRRFEKAGIWNQDADGEIETEVEGEGFDGIVFVLESEE